jgi:acyl-CoA thioesterase
MNDSDTLAAAVVARMLARDEYSKWLGVELIEVKAQRAVIRMTVREEMVNGFGVAHGGIVFGLADSAFAFACNGYNQRTVGHQASITYMASGRLGERLTAVAREVYRAGRNGIYDVHVTNERGELVAAFRGHSRTVKGTYLPA